MPGQLLDPNDDVGLLHADALGDDAAMHAGHAVLLVDTLVGACRQGLAVDQNAVAIENDES